MSETTDKERLDFVSRHYGPTLAAGMRSAMRDDPANESASGRYLRRSIDHEMREFRNAGEARLNVPLARVLLERAQDGYVNPTGGKTTGRERKDGA